MPAFDGVTLETLDAIKRAQTTGITTGTGLVGFSLARPAKSLVPVETPFRNILARTQAPEGSKAANWRVMLNVNNQQGDPSVAVDYAGSEIVFSEQDVAAAFKVLAYDGLVTRDAMNLARGFDDVHARAALGVLQQVMIGEDRIDFGGQNFALPTPATPTVTTSTTGGSIATATGVYVRVAARTGQNYYYGGGTVPTAAGTVTTGAGSTNSATATIAATKGAVAYDWYVGPAAGTMYYYTTTTVASVTITSIPVADGTVPVSTALPLVYNAGVAGDSYATANAGDRSAKVNSYNGFLATILGDYSGTTLSQVTPGTGTSSGAVLIDQGGLTLTANNGSITEIDNLLMQLYQVARLSPTALMMNAIHANDISVKVMGGGAAVTYLVPSDAPERANIAAGGYVAKYLNKAMGGIPVRIETHPSVPPGTIVARSDVVPYPNSNIDNVLEIETLEDYAEIPYAANRVANTAGGGPREEFEVRTFQTLKNHAPVAHAVLTNIKSG